MRIKSKLLIIAGSDSSGGAGIQADIKTITSLGSYAMTAITAITAQNTTGVASILKIPTKEISEKALIELKKMTWSGNIRELRNVIERLIILSEKIIDLKDVKKYV